MKVTYAAALSVLTFSGLAAAQDQASVAPPSGSTAGAQQPVQLEEVTVTGSRIKRTTDFNTPTPTTVIDSATMESMGIVNVGQAVQLAPSNVSNFTPANTGNTSFFTGAYIPDLRGLNPYFGSRTLTLINTQRAVQTGQGDQFDLNFIPQILVKRIDTVTGGASAAYGSGAISGVINVILDNKLEGGKIDADAYQTEHSDGRDRHVGAAYGHGLFDDRVHFVIGGEYENQDSVGCQDARTWCAQDAGLYQNGGYLSATGSTVATYAYGTNLRNNVLTPGGAFLSPSTFGPTPSTSSLQLSPDGTTVVPYVGGTLNGATGYYAMPTQPGQVQEFNPVVNNTTVEGGQGEPIYQNTILQAPLNRGVITGMLTGKVTDDINFNASVNWGRTQSIAWVPINNLDQPTVFPTFGLNGQDIIGSSTTVTSFGPTGPVVTTIPTVPNAYIANNSALLDAVNGGYNSLNKDWSEQIPSFLLATTSMRRFVIGFDGKFGESSWTWDGYGEYGLTYREQYQSMDKRAASYQMALDSVLVNGTPECRVTAAGGIAGVMDPTNPYYNPLASYAKAGTAASVLATNALLAQGCQPIDPFGTQPVSQAAEDYAFGYLDEHLRYEQTVAAFNASGNIWRGIGAGPFSLAAGVEWRQEVGHNDEVSCATGDAVCEARTQDFAAQYGTAFGGAVTVEEGYLETNLPLAKDLSFAHLLEVDLAARESRYDNKALYGLDVVNGVQPEDTHDLTTWKASLIFEPIEGIRFRGSQSRDMRAANFRELYYGQVLQSGATGGFGYCSHPTSANIFDDPCTVNLFGNTNLSPETSDTTTLGLVFSPTFLQGLQFSADWFHIRIRDAISAASLGQVELACTSGDQAACSNFTFLPNYYDPRTGSVVAAGTPGAVTGAAAWQAGIDNAQTVNAYAFNGAFYDERGVDFSLNYLAQLPDGSSLIARALTTWTSEQTYQEYAGGPVFNTLGQTGAANNFLNDVNPTPRWQGNLSITWIKGGFSLTPNVRWLGHGTLNYLGVTPDQTTLYNLVKTNDPSIRQYGYILLPRNYVPSYFLFGLNGTYSFDNVLKGLQIYAQVNNLFNKTPPFASSPGGFNSSYAGTNPEFFDTLGLATRIGFRLSF